MANQEHLGKIQDGATTWNRWRMSNPAAIVDFGQADLRSADLIGFNLARANLGSANLFMADLRSADLRGANLVWASASLTNFAGADLREASLSRANFAQADLRSADLSRATLQQTIFADVDLSESKGLESCTHLGPSTVGLDSLYRSRGEIPESFLRSCGVPESLITFARSLVGQAIEFYSCFISYSSHDQAFAERLYAELRAKGVRCWFAPEDLKIGDKFRSRIDESIRVFDKLLLILSRYSIASPWVEDEVEAALERERRENRLVLFPIRLDDAFMQTDVAWAAHLRQKRHVGDFSGWQDLDSHQRALARLLRDLTADALADMGSPEDESQMQQVLDSLRRSSQANAGNCLKPEIGSEADLLYAKMATKGMLVRTPLGYMLPEFYRSVWSSPP